MNTKKLLLIAVLNISAATCFAEATTVPAALKSIGELPASPVQRQVLVTEAKKTAEFARFEAMPVRAAKAFTYEGRSLSPTQLEVLGKKIK